MYLYVKFEYIKCVIKSRYLEKDRQQNERKGKKDKRQTMDDEILHRKLKIGQYKSLLKRW